MTHAALGGVYELLVQYTLFIKDAAMMYNKANTTRVECCVSGPDLMDTVLKHDFMTYDMYNDLDETVSCCMEKIFSSFPSANKGSTLDGESAIKFELMEFPG